MNTDSKTADKTTSRRAAATGGLALRVTRAPQVPSPINSAESDELRQVILPRIGLQLARQLPYDSWLRIGRQLSDVANTSSWCLGDWLVYGEATYNGRYRDAVDRTSLDYQTLRNYAWVARRFPLSRRRDSLSFGHHAEVAALPDPEQDFWLHKAQELGWSRNALRRELRASLRERGGRSEELKQDTAHAKPPASDIADSGTVGDDVIHASPVAEKPVGQEPAEGAAHSLVLNLTPSQLRFWREAAGRQGLGINDWAFQILCLAASNSAQTPARFDE